MKPKLSTQEFDEVYGRYKNILYRIGFTYLKNPEDVSDLLQEVFIKRLYHAPDFATKEAYQYESCIEYSPKVSEAGELYGIMISDKLYAIGDLKDVKLYPKEEEDGLDFLSYSSGKDYQTPILMQISLRTDKNTTQEYEDNELGFVSTHMNIDLTNDTSDMYDAEVYELENLGVKAVLYTVETDGPINWGSESGSIPCTNAVFVYKGVEYVYMGGVSHDTMKLFLNTLE